MKLSAATLSATAIESGTFFVVKSFWDDLGLAFAHHMQSEVLMRNSTLSIFLIATMLAPTSVIAQNYYNKNYVTKSENDTYEHGRSDNRIDWRSYHKYDYDRWENGQHGYYPDRYYRDGINYKLLRLGRDDRVYRGANGRFYCRRSDGTTGLIVNGLAGANLERIVAIGQSTALATLAEAESGTPLGQSIDRGNVVCR